MGLQAVKAGLLALPLPSINPVINLLLFLHLNTSHTPPYSPCYAVLMSRTSAFYCCLACRFVLTNCTCFKYISQGAQGLIFLWVSLWGWERERGESLTVCNIYCTIHISVSFLSSIFRLGVVQSVALWRLQVANAPKDDSYFPRTYERYLFFLALDVAASYTNISISLAGCMLAGEFERAAYFWLLRKMHFYQACIRFTEMQALTYLMMPRGACISPLRAWCPLALVHCWVR